MFSVADQFELMRFSGQLKSMAGQKHQHRGRPGKRGGSAPSSAKTSTTTNPDDVFRRHEWVSGSNAATAEAKASFQKYLEDSIEDYKKQNYSEKDNNFHARNTGTQYGLKDAKKILLAHTGSSQDYRNKLLKEIIELSKDLTQKYDPMLSGHISGFKDALLGLKKPLH